MEGAVGLPEAEGSVLDPSVPGGFILTGLGSAAGLGLSSAGLGLLPTRVSLSTLTGLGLATGLGLSSAGLGLLLSSLPSLPSLPFLAFLASLASLSPLSPLSSLSWPIDPGASPVFPRSSLLPARRMFLTLASALSRIAIASGLLAY